MDDTEDWLELYLKNSRDPFDYDLWADHYRHHLHPQILLRSTIIIQNTTPRHCNAIVIWFPERAARGRMHDQPHPEPFWVTTTVKYFWLTKQIPFLFDAVRRF